MRLSGLYVKLFAGFWLVLILSVLLVFWWASYGGSRILPAEKHELTKIQRLVDRMARHPPPRGGLRQGHRRGPGADLYLFDHRGGALHEGATPAALAAFVAETLQNAEPGQLTVPMRQVKEGWLWLGPMREQHGQQTVYAYLKLPLPPGRMALLHLWRTHPLMMIAGLILLSGLLLGLFAWHLSRPLRRLERVSAALSQGDLSQRVEPGITARHDEIGALARRLNSMTEAIGASFQAQRRLISDVSHELRSPLTRLQLATSLASRQHGQDPNLERVEKEAQTLEGMIASLLALSRDQMKGLERELFPLGDVLQQCADDAAYEGQHSNKQLHTDLDGTIRVSGNRSQLASAVSNLLGNALRHAQANVWLDVRRSAPDRVVIQVEDDGEGVPADQLEAVFRPFYRVSEARERDKGGAGLGLAIVAAVASSHGGGVTAENRSNGGLRVSLSLPCEP